MKKVRLQLGEILIKEGLLQPKQLEEALLVQQRDGGKIGEVLVRLGMVTEQDICNALGKQLGIPYVSLNKGLLVPDASQKLEELLPEDFARANLVLPISKHLNSLTAVLADPLNLVMLDNLARLTGCAINPIISTKSEIISAVDKFYGKRDYLKEAISGSYQITEFEHVGEKEEELSLDELIAKAGEAPVVKLVDLLIKEAVAERASDIHIEPFKDRLSIRYRIDGILYEISPPTKQLIPAIVSRIKILSHLDIAEKRLPQDGAFTVKVEDRVIDFRVSTIPVIYGEKVVIRILDKSQVPFDLKQLGFEPAELEVFGKAIAAPYGLILLTGPTGSGKSTTLYAALNSIKSPEKNIVTIEDPVEYRFEGINQVQARPNIGLTFASGLRAFLRQDPDVMMVGEIRDLETAEICIKAALTGHLVLSSLHTNDAAGAITRLVDIGIEPFLIVSSLLLVAAQRLVRRLCPDCKEAYEASPNLLNGGRKLKTDLIYRAKGCKKCNNTGYKGRIGIFEALQINEKIKSLISESAFTHVIKDVAHDMGMATLYESGLKKVEDGLTSLEEVQSVVVASEA